MNEFRDPDAWRTRSRIPRASGAWVGVARVETAPRSPESPRTDRPGGDAFPDQALPDRAPTEEAWHADSWGEHACIDDLEVPDHLDARAWAASMLAAEARKADAPRGRHGSHVPRQRAAAEAAAAAADEANPAADEAAWSEGTPPNPGQAWDTDSPAVAGREYSARRTPRAAVTVVATGRPAHSGWFTAPIAPIALNQPGLRGVVRARRMRGL